MITNYFFLLRSAKELNKKLSNSVLIDCFSQEKDSLIISFSMNFSENSLEFSTKFPGSHLMLRENFSRARKNTLSFTIIPSGAKFSGIRFHVSDRIIVLDFEPNYSILLYFRGARTNAFFFDGNLVSPFRKSDSALLEEIRDLLLTDKFSHLLQNVEDLPAYELITIQDPRLGKEIAAELAQRIQGSDDTDSELRKIISGILHGRFRISADKSGYRIRPECFLEQNPADSFCESALEAVSILIKSNFRETRFRQKKLQLVKEFTAQIKLFNKRKEDIENRIKLGNRSALFEKYAQILLMYNDKKEKGITELKLPDYMSQGEIVRIPLDEKLDINQNTRKYFDRAKEEHQSYEASVAKLPEIRDKISKFASDLKLIENCKSLLELSSFEEKEQKNKKPKTADDAVKFRAFRIEPNFIVYVGKDSRQNDELTLHFAKPNDIWMHARGCPGSHTVLRDTSGKNTFGKDVIKAAASIAAYFSKARNAKYVPVAYTEKKYVVKRKGMEPGKVQMMRESIVMAEPALPKDELNSKGDEL